VKSPRIEELAYEIGQREAGRARQRQAARRLAQRLRSQVLAAVATFVEAAAASGAPHLDLIHVEPVEPDDKSVRAFQFRITRGRHEGIVVSKDRGEVMLVGPFRRGGMEGPCLPFHLEGSGKLPVRLSEALESFLIRIIQQAYAK